MEAGWEAWVTVGVILLMLVALIRDIARTDLVILGALAILLVFGILTPEQAFGGFSNKAVLAVGALFVVAAGVQKTGALQFAERLLFSPSGNLQLTTVRLMFTTATFSAFLNNTPIVAMLIPSVRSWCEKTGNPASKLMIPLSFGAIVGGMTTLIGTSTNLLVAGLMESSGYEALHLFDFAWVGVPAALLAIIYFSLIGHRILPDRRKTVVRFEEGLRNCSFEFRIAPGSVLVGQSIEEAGLRALKDAYLVHLQRNDDIIPSSPDTILHAHDVLTFLGSAAVLDRLLERPGLERLESRIESPEHITLPLFEAVVSATSSLVGKSLRDAGFRERFHGVVLGIYRQDTPIEGSISRVPIQAGDLLLVEARDGFDKRWNQNRAEFYLVAARREKKHKPLVGKAPYALAILLGVVLIAAFGIADIVTTAFIGALAMLISGCLRTDDLRTAVDIPVLTVIAAAIGLGKAIEVTGLASAFALLVTSQTAILGTVGVLIAVYLVTSLLTELITNNAAAALMTGVGLAAAQQLGAPPAAFALAVAIAASASFMTPIGYQTNLMVLSAGGYRFSDFIKSGIIVNLLVGITAITMIWLHWL